MRQLIYQIQQGYTRVDSFLRQEQHYSAAMVRKLKLEHQVFKNGMPIRMVDPLCEGDNLTILLHEQCDLTPNPNLNATVVYADEDIVVYNKPALMPVHPSIRHYEDTLGNLYAAQFTGGYHPINRLDANTTGLCLIARHGYAAARLSGVVEKEYTALACGILPDKIGTIDAPIAREDDSIIKRVVAPHGKRSVTHYTVVEERDGYSLAKIRLETGRTHQIRVHFAHLGFPLAGDDLYGGSMQDYTHHMLCCTALTFPHPISKQIQSFRINMHL